jgi:hypothetical protein
MLYCKRPPDQLEPAPQHNRRELHVEGQITTTSWSLTAANEGSATGYWRWPIVGKGGVRWNAGVAKGAKNVMSLNSMTQSDSFPIVVQEVQELFKRDIKALGVNAHAR